MDNFTEVNAENLRFIRGAKGMSQEAVAEILGLQGYHISNIEKGRRALADSEKKLLDLYFFGKMPSGIVRSPQELRGILEFTPDEWRIIQIMAARSGTTAGKWIAAKAREYLTWNDEARKAQAEQQKQEGFSTLPLAAEDSPEYPKKQA